MITPRRALSILADPSKRGIAIKMFAEPSWGVIKQRLLTRGADRTLAVALWAFADDLSPSAAVRMREHAGRLWQVLPTQTPAAPDAYDALRTVAAGKTLGP